VLETHISSFKAIPDIDKGMLRVSIKGAGMEPDDQIRLRAKNGMKTAGEAKGPADKWISLPIQNAKLWSPESPHLYDLTIELFRKGKVIDKISTYFGMRKISLKKNGEGIPTLMLNNRRYFHLGTLDQGWWPDGLYTAPTDEALAFDIIKTKEHGFNTIRKHVKIEPARWVYHCDRLGMLVWQDMPSGDMRGSRAANGERERRAQSAYQYENELKAMIDQFINSPSIVIWIPFNEGWGQFDTIEISNWIKHYDPSRLVGGPSGWYDFTGAGDIQDVHKYPGPAMPDYKNDSRALVLGEFGGLGLPISGHTWQKEKNWGYRSYTSNTELQTAYVKLIDQIPELIERGLSAAIYTQTTDVEIEVNGLMTYDREVIKMNVDEIRKKNRSLYK
jgi:hypothetical protein